MSASTFKSREIPFGDLISQANAISPDFSFGCHFPHTGLKAEDYVEFAKLDLIQGDQRGWLNSITNAKRAVCSRIDAALRLNHLHKYLNKNYPEKIETLNLAGISIPKVVQRWVIDPRNLEEHEYRIPNDIRSHEAVEIASLFISATQAESERSITITRGRVPTFQTHFASNDIRLVSMDRPEGAMLFVDVFREPNCILIINCDDETIDYVNFANLNKSDSVAFTTFLRSPNFARHCTPLPSEIFLQMRSRFSF